MKGTSMIGGGEVVCHLWEVLIRALHPVAQLVQCPKMQHRTVWDYSFFEAWNVLEFMIKVMFFLNPKP